MILHTIGAILVIILRIYTFVLWGRFVLDWVMVLNRRFRPKGALAILVEVVYTATDPPIKMFRRVLPPLRIGNVALDLGWFLTMISCMILIAIVGSW
ncbi:YggT family protein [Leucobacter zeae]|nr:YggT family protein [Leucobacter zeae]